MSNLQAYRKQAKLLVRWHQDQNYSIGDKLRLLERFRHLTDRELLDRPLPLPLAREVVAVEAGFADWPALEAATSDTAETPGLQAEDLRVLSAVPILFVRDVAAAAAFYRDKLSFEIDFLHGKPPFYGALRRDGGRLHLRGVTRTNFAALAATEPSLILATFEVTQVKVLFEEYKARQVSFAQSLVRQAWGGADFQVRDPDGNVISFVQYQDL